MSDEIADTNLDLPIRLEQLSAVLGGPVALEPRVATQRGLILERGFDGRFSFRLPADSAEMHHDESWINIKNHLHYPQDSDYHHHLTLRRQEGTGQWFLNSTRVQTWMKSRGQVFICPGVPGAGKSVLVSFVVDELATRAETDRKTAVACIYDAHRCLDQGMAAITFMAQLLGQILAALIVQFTDKATLTACQGPFYIRKSQVAECLRIACSNSFFSRIFMILDGLELSTPIGMPGFNTAMDVGMDLMSWIASFQQASGVSVLVTPRTYNNQTSIKPTVTMEIRARKEDIETYLDAQIDLLPLSVSQNKRVMNRIKDVVWESCAGV